MKRFGVMVLNQLTLFIIKLSFKLSAVMLRCISKLPFAIGVSPVVFYTSQWVELLDCFPSRRGKLLFSITRVVDAFTLSIRYGVAPMFRVSYLERDICHGCDDCSYEAPADSVPFSPAVLYEKASLPADLLPVESEKSTQAVDPVLVGPAMLSAATFLSADPVPLEPGFLFSDICMPVDPVPLEPTVLSARTALTHFIGGSGMVLGGSMGGGYVSGASY